MKVEVINTGSELLLGSVLNTHLKYFAESLFPVGIRIQRQVTVPDGDAIGTALAESFARADVVLVTGGLGPTTDDITREAVAELLGLELIHDDSVMEAITARFERRGFTMSERNARQAQRPREAVVLPNSHGTAPGLYLPPQPLSDSRWGIAKTPHLFLLPGPPRELRPMFTEAVLPLLQKLAPATAAEEMRVVRVSGMGESAVEELVGADILALGLELGYCARPGEVDVRLIGDPAAIAIGEAILREKLGSRVVSNDGRLLEAVVVDLLASRGEFLAVAESCTGGLLANRLTNVPGASMVFVEGFVTYANEAKIRGLDVDPAVLREHGAVSRQVAAAMARGAVAAARVDHAVATTGIAGPGGGTDKKPVGTVYIAFASKSGEVRVERHNIPTDRETFKFLATQAALDLIRRSVPAVPSEAPLSTL
ncbi:MAG TPA: CinA family nicotinamide mononucleotide deamidase-related protein [Chthoniobacteraceae bacterium]|jgi:nicotinamide-nucleotide amidase